MYPDADFTKLQFCYEYNEGYTHREVKSRFTIKMRELYIEKIQSSAAQ